MVSGKEQGVVEMAGAAGHLGGTRHACLCCKAAAAPPKTPASCAASHTVMAAACAWGWCRLVGQLRPVAVQGNGLLLCARSSRQYKLACRWATTVSMLLLPTLAAPPAAAHPPPAHAPAVFPRTSFLPSGACCCGRQAVLGGWRLRGGALPRRCLGRLQPVGGAGRAVPAVLPPQ